MDEPDIILPSDPGGGLPPAALASGVTAIVEVTRTVCLMLEGGTLDELPPDDHRAYAEVGSIQRPT